MQVTQFLILIALSLQWINVTFGNTSRKRTTADRIESFGYNSEIHNVVTNDSFVISLFRLKHPAGKDTRPLSPRPVVLMMHGLTSSSDCWILTGPQTSLAFLLLNNGYDVWLGNSRGNPYGSHHLAMSKKDKKFWRFSWHEIGSIDLPSLIDYILTETGQSSLHYVGHSQGTAILFVLLSGQPTYNKKIKTSHLLAPIAYMKHASSGLIHDMAPLLGRYSRLDPALGDMPFLQQAFLRQILGFEKCRSPGADMELCAYIAYTIYGGYSAYINISVLPDFFETHPASCSTHQAIHLVQLHVSGHFRQYDFGDEGNMKRYNRLTPPDYEVENINTRFPMDFYYSAYDELSSNIDVEKFSNILGNKSVNHFIDLKNFAHLDFLAASNVKEVINDGILKRINDAELLLKGN